MWKWICSWFNRKSSKSKWEQYNDAMDNFWWREFFMRYPEKRGQSREELFNEWTGFCIEHGRTW